MKSQYIVISIILILILLNIISVVNYIYRRDQDSNNDIFKQKIISQESSDYEMDIPEAEMDIPEAKMDIPEAEMDIPEAEMDIPEAEMDILEAEVDKPECIEDIIETYKDQLEIETQKFLSEIEDSAEEDDMVSKANISDEINKLILSWMENRMVNIFEDYIEYNKECVIQYDISTISNAFHEYVRSQLLKVTKQFYINYAYKYDVPASAVGFNALLRNCNKEIKYDVHQDMYEFIESYLSNIPKCSELIGDISGDTNIGCCPIKDDCVNCSPVTSVKKKCYCCIDTSTKKNNSYMTPCHKVNEQIENNLTKMMKTYGNSICLKNKGCTIKNNKCVCSKIINASSFVPCMKSNQYKNYKNGCEI